MTTSPLLEPAGGTEPRAGRSSDRTRPGGRPTLAVRRWFLVAAPVLAGVFATIAAAADPAVGLDGRRLWELYAANPEPLQIKSLSFHWAYAFWFAPTLLVAPYIRGRGAWLAIVTALVEFAWVLAGATRS